MTEFRIAHQLVAQGRKKFLIPLLLEDVNPNELGEVDADLKLYIETHTYTDCRDLVSFSLCFFAFRNGMSYDMMKYFTVPIVMIQTSIE